MTRPAKPRFLEPMTAMRLQQRSAQTGHVIVYYAFDVLHLDGRDVIAEPLEARRALLPAMTNGSGVMLSHELPGNAADVTAAVAALGLEGVIAKRRDSRYD